jgi:N-acetylglutamate synthase-like GNAT family acetyltransferase
MRIRAAETADRDGIAAFLEGHGMRYAARLGELHDPIADEALLDEDDGDLVGVLTYDVDGPDFEISALYAATSRQRIGSALIEAVVEAARAAGSRRLWLVMTSIRSRPIGGSRPVSASLTRTRSG